MHRARCLLFVTAALGASLVTHSTFAQQTPSPKAAAKHARTTAKAQAAPAGRLTVRLRLGDGVQTYHPSRRQLGVAYAPGSSDGTPAHFVVDRAKLRAYLNKIAPDVRRHPQDAKVVVAVHNASDDGSAQVPAKIVPGHDGAVLDTDAAVDLIQKTLQTAPGTLHIVLPVKTKPADVRAADLAGITARVGYFVTRFNPGDVGRTETVRRAISIIDGSVVKPGETFSVDQTVGPRDPAHGFFGKGHVFVDGHMEMQSGGGMCQVATTLFNAVMLADLKIKERHQHVRTIPYADPGRDATIYHGQKDFKFVNDTGAPIYVSYKTTRSHAITALFGMGVPGRKVRLVDHHRQLGERHFTGVFYRVVTEPDGTKHRDPAFYSNYKWTPDLDFSR